MMAYKLNFLRRHFVNKKKIAHFPIPYSNIICRKGFSAKLLYFVDLYLVCYYNMYIIKTGLFFFFFFEQSLH